MKTSTVLIDPSVRIEMTAEEAQYFADWLFTHSSRLADKLLAQLESVGVYGEPNDALRGEWTWRWSR